MEVSEIAVPVSDTFALVVCNFVDIVRNIPVGPDTKVSESVKLASDEFVLVVPSHLVDEVEEISVEPEIEVINPVVLGSEEFVLIVPFHPVDEVDGAKVADAAERVPL
jgi:hypothetical protein